MIARRETLGVCVSVSLAIALVLVVATEHVNAAAPQPKLPMPIPVLVVKYFPVDGDRIDQQVTGDWGASLAETRQKTDQQTRRS